MMNMIACPAIHSRALRGPPSTDGGGVPDAGIICAITRLWEEVCILYCCMWRARNAIINMVIERQNRLSLEIIDSSDGWRVTIRNWQTACRSFRFISWPFIAINILTYNAYKRRARYRLIFNKLVRHLARDCAEADSPSSRSGVNAT